MKYLDDLMFWVGERERMRFRRAEGHPPPWTTDPILHHYRFCNVDRCYDRVTQWIHNNWLKPNNGAPSLPFAMAVARMVNLPETLADLGYPYIWDNPRFIEVLARRKLAGKKVWTSAYMITGGYSAGGESKEVIIARVLTTLYNRLLMTPVKQGDTLDDASFKLRVPGIGTFLSAQIIADLKYNHVLEEAKDWDWWCAPGPGSTLGLNFLYERPELTALNEAQFIREVNEVKTLLRHAGVHLDAQNVQNCLCEFSKYVRAKHFGKRLKSGFTPYIEAP